MKYIINCFVLIFLNSVASIAQTKIYKYSDLQASFNLDSLEKNVSSAFPNKNKLFNAIALLEKSRLKYGSCRFGESLKQLDSLTKMIKTDEANEINLVLSASFKMANYENKIDILNALSKAADIGQKLKDTITLVDILYKQMFENIKGQVYLDDTLSQSNKLLVKSYYEKIINITKNTSNLKLKLAECYVKAEYFFNEDTSCDMVIKSALEGLKILEVSYEEDIYIKNLFYTTLSACYNFNKDFSKALLYSKKALMLPKTECSTTLSLNLFSMANCYYEMEQNDSALKYYSRAIDAIKKTKFTDLMLLEYCYDRISVIQYYKENYKQAFEDLYVRDSLFAYRTQKEKSNLSVALQHKYEYENNIQKIAMLEKQKKQNTIASLIGLVVFLIITTLLIYSYKAKKKLKYLVNFRNKIIAIISHDLRSPLYALQGLNDDTSYLIKNNRLDELTEIINEIDLASTKITNTLNSLLIWAASNSENRTKGVVRFDLQNSINETIALYSKVIEAKQITIINIQKNPININANKNVLELVLRNWIDNTIKYAMANYISIDVVKYDNVLKIVITDNGFINEKVVVSIKKQLQNSNDIQLETETGLGLELVAYFSKKEHWKIDLIANKNNNVFSVEINMI